VFAGVRARLLERFEISLVFAFGCCQSSALLSILLSVGASLILAEDTVNECTEGEDESIGFLCLLVVSAHPHFSCSVLKNNLGRKGKATADVVAQKADGLYQHTWKLAEIGLLGALRPIPPEFTLTLQFEEELRIHGKSACNRSFATYHVDRFLFLTFVHQAFLCFLVVF
jgi:hypothetical protein